MTQLRLAVVAALAASALLLTSCAGSSPGAGEAAPAVSDKTAELGISLEAAVAPMLADRGIPGAVFLVTKDGVDQWSYEYNSAERDAEPVSLEQNFGYRSVTKSFTVSAVLMLADEGRLGLDDPISTYVDGVPNGDQITLRQLADMRSGLANYSSQPEVGQMIMDDPTGEFSSAEIIAPALALPPLFAPGEKFMYSNTNTVLLGMMIEEVTGEPWAIAVASLLTEPLGLDSVSYPVGVAPSPSAVPYQWTDDTLEALPLVSPTLFGAAGGLFGAVGDLAKWADELGTGSLLKPETQKERLASFGSTADDPGAPEYDAYGLGIGKIGDYVGHTGTGLGFQALAMHDPASGVSVAILLNSTTEDSDLPAHLFAQLEPVLAALK